MKKIQTTLIAAMTFVLMCSTSWAATYYINGANGNDANPGSQSAPWKTIGKANNSLKAGDTVYIKKGTYKETIHPSRSGEKGSYITYARNGNDEVLITGISGSSVDLRNKSYVIVDGIKILDVGGFWVDMYPNGSHNIIKNCHFEEGGKYQGIYMRDGANYNQILNNTLIGRCGPSNLIIAWDSNHNLIDGNNLYYCPHDAIGLRDQTDGTTNYNIIRNNYIQNRWHTNLDITGVEHVLVENNIIVDAGENAADGPCSLIKTKTDPRYVHKGIQLSSKYGIVRNNVLVNNGYGIELVSWDTWKGPSENNRVYNNTISGNYRGVEHWNTQIPAIDNIIKNNIIYNNKDYEIIIAAESDKNYFINNNILGAPVRYATADVRQDNISKEPYFMDTSGRDFHLLPNSEMINAGAFLTTTANSGNGKTISVEDAHYFMDGWGIIKGDLIQMEGQTKTARITSVDYKNNTITVDTPLFWTKGKGVSMPYKGSAPDIGAFEFENDANRLQPPYNLRVQIAQIN